jgi:glycosyltransferase involved in cell wall biosynthesis
MTSGVAVAAPPLVSVILCVRDGGPQLRLAVVSVLQQTWRHLELILVDDGSTDGAVEAVPELGDPRVVVIRQPNAGKPAALNRALVRARGEFYAIQDADDVSAPIRIERQVRCLLANPDAAGVFCGYELILDGVRVAPRSAAKDAAACRRDIERFRMPGHDPTAMYRLAAVRGLRYDEDTPIGEGLDYVLRVGERWPLLVLGECLYAYRIDRRSLTKRDPRRARELVRAVLARACARRGIAAADGPPLLREARRARLRPQDRDNNLAAHFIESAVDLCRAGRRGAALRVGLRCVALCPWRLHYWKALVLAAVPESIWPWLRRQA